MRRVRERGGRGAGAVRQLPGQPERRAAREAPRRAAAPRAGAVKGPLWGEGPLWWEDPPL